MSFGPAVVYMVVRNDSLAQSNHIPSLDLCFGPRRRTINWRGRKFNVPTFRLVRLGDAKLGEVKAA